MTAHRLTILIELILIWSNILCCSLNDTHAIILARSGSKGIRNKNLLRFNGSTLLGRTIGTIKKTGLFENIWVSTDGDLIAKEALKNGALVYQRLSVFAQDRSSSLDAVREFLYKHSFVHRFALFQCTSVFLREHYITAAYEKFKHNPCVFAATKSHKLRWKKIDNYMLPINFNNTKRPRRQDWEGEFIETGMFYFSTRQLVHENCLQNYRCAIVEIDNKDAIEIDNISDLEISQCMLETDYKAG